MDYATLVENHITDGEKVLASLAESGIPLTAAAWVRIEEDDKWFLYLATPLVKEKSRMQAYARVNEVIREQQPNLLWVDPLAVKLLATDAPLARGILEAYQRYPVQTSFRFPGDHLGKVSIEGAYIYPLPVAVSGS